MHHMIHALIQVYNLHIIIHTFFNKSLNITTNVENLKNKDIKSILYM